MRQSDPGPEIEVAIPVDLDVPSATEAHAILLAALDEVEASGRVVELELQGREKALAPLALQLLISAAGSFPPGQIRFGSRAAAVLAAQEVAKEN
jgi:hypothetical protein